MCVCESNWGTDLPAGCVLAVVLSEHTRTVAGCVCVWESNWGTDILAGCVCVESNWGTDLPVGCVSGTGLSEHTRTVAGDGARRGAPGTGVRGG